MHLWKKLIASAAISVALLVGGPAGVAAAVPASPAAPSVQVPAASPLVSTAGKSSWTEIGCGEDNNCLPYKRWMEATQSFHGRFDGFGGMAATSYQVQAGVSGALLSVGNFMFSVGGSVLDMSQSMDVLSNVGAAVDKGFAAIGGLFIKSPLIAILLVFSVGGALFGSIRGQNKWRRLGATLLIVGMLSAMVSGAAATSTKVGSTKDSAGCVSVTKFGVLSPGWMANITNVATCHLVAGIGNALDSAADDVKTENGDYLTGGSCATYVDRLVTQAKDKGGASPMELQLNNTWMNSGLVAWAQTQFGTTPKGASSGSESKAKDSYGQSSYCHALDVNSGRKVENQILLSFNSKDAATKAGAVNDGNFNTRSPMFIRNSDDKNDDRALVAWAACQYDSSGKVTVPAGFAEEASGKNITPNTCKSAMETSSAPKEKGDKPKGLPGDLDFPGSTSDINSQYEQNKTSYADWSSEVDYLSSLHGNNLVSNGSGPMFAYLIAAFACCAVYVLAGIFIIIAKLAAAIMVLTLVFVLAAAVVKGDGFDGVLKYAKTYVGFAIIANAGALILMVISIVAKIIQNVGVAASGSFISLLWAGLSPLLAVLMLHFVLKKIFKMPGLSPAAALAWGGMAGGVGAVAGAGLVNRLQSRAAGAPGRLGRAGMGAAGRGLPKGDGATGAAGVAGAAGALGAGAKNRSGRMTLAGAAKAGAGVGALGAAGAAGVAGVAGVSMSSVEKTKKRRGLAGLAENLKADPSRSLGDRVQGVVNDSMSQAGRGAVAAGAGVGAGALAALRAAKKTPSTYRSAVAAAKNAPARIGAAKAATVGALRKAPTAAKAALNSGRGATQKAIGYARDNYRNPAFWRGAGSAAVQVGKAGVGYAGRGIAGGASATGRGLVATPGLAARGLVDGAAGAGRGLAAAHRATRPGRRALLGAASGVLTGDAKNIVRGAVGGHKAGLAKNEIVKQKRVDRAQQKLSARAEAAATARDAAHNEIAANAPKAPELPDAPSRAALEAADHARKIAAGKADAAEQRLAQVDSSTSIAEWKALKAEQDAAYAHQVNMDYAHSVEADRYRDASAAHQQLVQPQVAAHEAEVARGEAARAAADAAHQQTMGRLTELSGSENVVRDVARADRAEQKATRALAAQEKAQARTERANARREQKAGADS